ncbi:putative leader peptide [Nakamurella multipartita]
MQRGTERSVSASAAVLSRCEHRRRHVDLNRVASAICCR